MPIQDNPEQTPATAGGYPNLENLKKQAKTLLKSIRSGDTGALARVGPYFGDPAKISLQAAQLVLARENGFSSWTNLKRFTEQGKLTAELSTDQLASQFLDLVVLQYSQVPDIGPARFEQAARLLDDHPDIRFASIYTAAAIGDVEMIDKWLDKQPGLVNQKGGFHQWEPLMYACYARLPGASTLPAALRLLHSGADPDAFYMWNGQYRFTALTGAFGQGEAGPHNQPEHPDYVQLCRALLRQGANPNDSQAAYNRCFEPDNTCFELLLEFGLNDQDKNNWLLAEDGELVSHPDETLHYHLIHSIRKGYTERAELLIDHGVDVNKPANNQQSGALEISPYELAMQLGETAIADHLLAHGAHKTELSAITRLQSACSSGDKATAEQIYRENPGLREKAAPLHQELLGHAVNKGNLQALQVMIELGFDLNDNSARLPLADAAWSGNLDAIKMLLDNGADPTLRDPVHFTPPIGFALYAKQHQVVAFLDSVDMDIFTAATRGKIDRITAHLQDNPAQLDMRFADIRPARHKTCEGDWMTPLVYAAICDQSEAVQYLLEQGADPQVNNGSGLSLLSLLQERQGDSAVIALIESATGSV